jgi:hypothetical protein
MSTLLNGLKPMAEHRSSETAFLRHARLLFTGRTRRICIAMNIDARRKPSFLSFVLSRLQPLTALS